MEVEITQLNNKFKLINMQKQLSFQTTVTIIATFGLLIFTIFQFIEGSFFDTVMELELYLLE
jgi:hypothetical protein